MSTKSKAVVASALKLPERERVLVAREILNSLDETGANTIDAAWKQEIRRRLKEMRTGTVKWKSGNDVLKALKRKYQS